MESAQPSIEDKNAAFQRIAKEVGIPDYLYNSVLEKYGGEPDKVETWLRARVNVLGKNWDTLMGTSKPTSISIPKSSRLAYVNNNPGNLRFAGQKGAKQGEGGFARFPTPEEGYMALKNQIKLDASRGLTLAKFISKYAPPTENDTKKYIDQITSWTGYHPNSKLSSMDVERIARAMARKESSSTFA